MTAVETVLLTITATSRKEACYRLFKHCLNYVFIETAENQRSKRNQERCREMPESTACKMCIYRGHQAWEFNSSEMTKNSTAKKDELTRYPKPFFNETPQLFFFFRVSNLAYLFITIKCTYNNVDIPLKSNYHKQLQWNLHYMTLPYTWPHLNRRFHLVSTSQP